MHGGIFGENKVGKLHWLKAALGLLMAATLLAGIWVLVHAQGRTEKFEYPSKQDDFCGIAIPAQYCKCAFHGQYCEDIGMSRDAAISHVDGEYRSWVVEQVKTFARACMTNGGIWYRPSLSCLYCDPGYSEVSGQCQREDESQTVAERYGLPDPHIPVPTGPGTGVKVRLVRPEGEIFVYSADWQMWKGPVTGEATLRDGDQIRTGPDGQAVLIFENLKGARDDVTVSSNSILQLPVGADKPADEGFWATLWHGAVYVFGEIVNPTPNKNPFQVRTPMIVTGRRGTEFLVRYDSQARTTTVLLHEGALDVWQVDDPAAISSLYPGEMFTDRTGDIAIETVAQGGWESALNASGLPLEREDVSDIVIPPDEGFDIDPNLVYPPEALDDLAGDLPGLPIEHAPGAVGNFGWATILLCCAALACLSALFAGGVVYFVKIRPSRAGTQAAR